MELRAAAGLTEAWIQKGGLPRGQDVRFKGSNEFQVQLRVGLLKCAEGGQVAGKTRLWLGLLGGWL